MVLLVDTSFSWFRIIYWANGSYFLLVSLLQVGMVTILHTTKVTVQFAYSLVLAGERVV